MSTTVTTRAHILLVEDDPGTARLVRRRLEQAGYTVSVAGSPADAMDHLRRQHIDLMLLDNRLPGGTGLDFYVGLKASGYEVPAIMMTGFSDEATVITALRIGMRDFIPKSPQFLDSVPDAVERVLKQVGLEQRLASFEQRLAGIINAATDAIITVESDGRITLFNPAAERIFGCRAADALDQPLGRFFTEDLAGLQRCDAVSGPSRIELEGRRLDGQAFPVEAACFDVAVAGHAFTTLIVTDISERKRMERERVRLVHAQAAREEAEAANRAKDEFLATVSHELRTPLTSMLGWARLLQSGKLDPDHAARALQRIERNTELLAVLIEDLLDISRIVSGKLQLDRRVVDLAAIVRDVGEAASHDAETSGIALDMCMPPAPIPVVGDPLRLHQVFSNLLGNAFKFTPPGGEVRVRAERTGDSVRVVVADTGAGIDRDLLPHIFERFRRGDVASRRAGLGLGLAIARHFVEAHGGRIAAESPGPGLGATVVVELPVATEADPGVVETSSPGRGRPTAEPPQLDGLRILVVDDDVDSRELVAFVFRRCGANVASAGSLAEALAILDDAPVDVVVADLAMPGGDGYELLQRLRASEHGSRRPPVPVLAFTGHASRQDRQRALAAGFAAYVAKPVDPFELVQLVSSVAATSNVAATS